MLISAIFLPLPSYSTKPPVDYFYRVQDRFLPGRQNLTIALLTEFFSLLGKGPSGVPAALAVPSWIWIEWFKLQGFPV